MTSSTSSNNRLATPSTSGPLIVEFIGPGGIGKTALVNAVAAELRAAGAEVVDGQALRLLDERRGGRAVNEVEKPREILLFAWHIVRFPRFAWAVHSFARTLGEPRRKRLLRARRALGLLSVLAETARQPGVDVVLVDEGVTNTLWSLCVGVEKIEDERGLQRTIQAYAESLPIVFVRLVARAEVVIERVFARDDAGSRFSNASDAAARAAFCTSLEHQRLMENRLPQSRIVAEVDAEADLSSMVEFTLERLRAMRPHLPAAANLPVASADV